MSDSLIKKLTYSGISTLICCCIIMIYYAIYKKGKKIHFEDLVAALLLVFISSLRYGVGSDYFRYLESSARWVRLFESDIASLFSVNVLQQYSYEIGYKLLSVLANRLSTSPYTIFWLVSIVMYVPLVIYCRKYTNDARIALAIYLLFGYWGISLNVIGQSIAMILLLIANKAIDSKKYVWSTLLIICAETFHTTAIIAAILLLLTRFAPIKKFLKPTRRNLVKMIIIGIILRFSTEIFINLVSRTKVFAKYTRYITSGISDIPSRVYMMFGTLVEGVLIIMILYMAIKKIEKSNDNKLLSNMATIVMIGIPLNIIGISRSDWMWLSNRFAEYFFIFLIVLIPELIKSTELDTNRGVIAINRKRLPFWFTLILWHALFAIVMFNNNQFVIDTYLFK